MQSLGLLALTAITAAWSAVPQRALVITAHGDDHILVMSRELELVRAGCELHCATFGGRSATHGPLDALEIIGVPRDHLHVLGPGSGWWISDYEKPIEKIVGLLKTIRPQELYTTAYNGGHWQHDCVNLFCAEAIRRSGLQCTLMEFNNQSAYYLPPKAPLRDTDAFVKRWLVLIPCDGEQYAPRRATVTDQDIELLERTAMAWGIQWMLDAFKRHGRDLSRRIFREQAYRLAPPHDYTSPPHGPTKANPQGKLLWEVVARGHAVIGSFDTFRNLALAVRSRYGPLATTQPLSVAWPPPTKASFHPGDTVRLRLSVTNKAEEQDTFTVRTALQRPPSTSRDKCPFPVAIQPSNISCAGKATTQATVTFTLPADAPPGGYVLWLSVVSLRARQSNQPTDHVDIPIVFGVR